MADDTEQKGIPIYLEPTDRSMVNAMDEPNIDIDAWYPSNTAAQKLWRCLESMLDLEEVLEFAAPERGGVCTGARRGMYPVATF